MITNDDQEREIKQWGLIINLARDRKKLSEMRFSNAERIILNVISKLESKLQEVKDL